MRPALLAVALLLLPPAAAPAETVDLPELFQDVLPEVNEKTEVPVLLPQRYRSDSEGNFASGEGRRRGYTLSLAAVRNCGGATACFIGTFGGQRGEDPHYTRKVRLTGGRTGYFKPLTCGASCSPPRSSGSRTTFCTGSRRTPAPSARRRSGCVRWRTPPSATARADR